MFHCLYEYLPPVCTGTCYPPYDEKYGLATVYVPHIRIRACYRYAYGELSAA